MSNPNTNPNVAVQQLGQSFWYDNIQRSIIQNGELQHLIDEYGVLGVTSNPSIFEKAIAGSADYDEDIARLMKEGADIQTIYEQLAVADIQAAADILEPVYEQTNGLDGYVSLEVSPELARDCEGTVNEARRLHRAVGRKNLMIKVPATPECIPAIRQLIADGININVTLIFSLEGYEAVARAFIDGLKARAAQGLSLDVASVASFFVSRVDTLVDKLLDEKIAQTPEWDQELRTRLSAMKSKAAIANAKLAYQIFKRIFDEPEWKALESAGARPQRVLWASTSTKNPSLPDTYYVDTLIGPHTVNTLPPQTLKAFRDHGRVALTVERDAESAAQLMDDLEQAGISMPHVWQKLQDDGVRLFSEAFQSLLKSIEAKRAAILARGEAAHVDVALGYVSELVRMKAASRAWRRDASLWTTAPEHIKVVHSRLGWLSTVESMAKQVDHLNSFVKELKAAGFTDAVVLGMGGSSLAPEVLRATFQPSGEANSASLRLHVLDTTDPTTVLSLERNLNLAKTVFIVASKSGTTVEINSFYKYFRAKADVIAGDAAGQQFVAITDEGTPLQSLAEAEKFRRIFINPSDIGGRYSALSYFGLVPGALAGVDIGLLLQRGARMAEWCKADSPANPGLWLGALLGGMALASRDKVTFILSPAIAAFGIWVEQLIAESTGKQGRGIVPVEGELVNLRGAISKLSTDRLYVHLRLEGDDTHDRLVTSLKRAKLPVIEIRLADLYDLGTEFFRWEFATAIASLVLGVNPFDEPNVTESKTNTKRLLDEFETIGMFSSEQSSRSANAQLNKFLRSAGAGDYVSVQAYLPYNPRIAVELERMRAAIGARTGVPVTVGYGPRFLHSTGQLHKGGANNVVAVQLTYDPEQDVPIPGEPYSFGTLIRAQALGDYEALTAHNRRVIRLHVGRDPLNGLKKIVQTLKGTSRRTQTVTKPSAKKRATTKTAGKVGGAGRTNRATRRRTTQARKSRSA
ncbi:MAG: bifunctional transaldolase/phosoglucose isomerase [Anaerolineae bacterium]|nr:bifunctional transaldolase/phosoglucose isomerase [Thermoflexales bacterium]MDW8407759.1 bifunctional transaldolase/phosoglucose isomerase [Anaerolineae bacterium]